MVFLKAYLQILICYNVLMTGHYRYKIVVELLLCRLTLLKPLTLFRIKNYYIVLSIMVSMVTF